MGDPQEILSEVTSDLTYLCTSQCRVRFVPSLVPASAHSSGCICLFIFTLSPTSQVKLWVLQSSLTQSATNLVFMCTDGCHDLVRVIHNNPYQVHPQHVSAFAAA